MLDGRGLWSSAEGEQHHRCVLPSHLDIALLVDFGVDELQKDLSQEALLDELGLLFG